MTYLQHIKPQDISDNIFSLIGTDWALLSAYDKNHSPLPYNTMTVSWGGAGVLWNKNVFFCFVRPQRYTKEFIDASDKITLSFFGEQYKKALTHCGKVSGKDCDKIKEACLSPVTDNGYVSFKESRLTLYGKKLYESDITQNGFIDKSIIPACYKDLDFHTMYICEITDVVICD